MPKKGGKKGKGPSIKAPDYCVDQFGVPPGARLVTPSGVIVTVAGMGVIDEKLYAMFPGGFLQPLGGQYVCAQVPPPPHAAPRSRRSAPPLRAAFAPAASSLHRLCRRPPPHLRLACVPCASTPYLCS